MHFKISSAICFSFDQSKILLSGNGLSPHQKNEFTNHVKSKQKIAQHILTKFLLCPSIDRPGETHSCALVVCMFLRLYVGLFVAKNCNGDHNF